MSAREERGKKESIVIKPDPELNQEGGPGHRVSVSTEGRLVEPSGPKNNIIKYL